MSQMIYTVGNEQDYHFKVLFLILEKLGFEWAKECYHLSYGMVDLPTGKMKSREGTVVDADDLMQEMHNTAREKALELGKIEGLSAKEQEELFETIGMAALKYFILKVDPKKRMLFNPEESVDFNGNTGPFIQYAHARISSLLRAAQPESLNFKEVNITPQEKNIIKHLLEFPNIVSEAGKEYNPALIANYTYDLVKMYNHFYQSHPILKNVDSETQNFRLLLSQETGKIIRNAMKLLGIKVPERM
jgi:arginyl-tRNA synthetase